MKRLIIIIFLCLIAVRIIHLGADLPVARTEILQNVGEFYYDEGWWSLGSRDLLLFNNPDHSNFNTMPLTPVSSAIYLVFFKIFGLNLIALRLIGFFASMISIFIFFNILRKHNMMDGILGMVVFGFSSLFIIYSKTGLLEMICLPLLLGAMATYLNKHFFITGILIGLAVITKVHTVFFLLVFLFFPRRLRVLVGFLIVFVPWIFLIFHQPVLSHYQSSRWLTAGNPVVNIAKSLFIGLVYRDTFFRNNPLFFIFGLFALPGLYHAKDQTSRLFFLWAIIGGLFFGIFPFQPARYLILLIPPLTFALIKAKESDNRFLITIVAIIVVSQTVFGIFRPFVDHYHGLIPTFPGSGDYKLAVAIPHFLKTHDLSIYPDFFARMIIYVLLAGVSILIGIIVGITKWRIFKPRRTIIPFVIIFDLFLNAWIVNPHYSFLKFGHRLSRDIDGKVAPAGTFSVMNQLDYDNLPVLKRDMDNPDLYPEYALLISRHPLLGKFSSQRFFKQFAPVVVYPLFNSRYEVTLYERIADSPLRP